MEEYTSFNYKNPQFFYKSLFIPVSLLQHSAGKNILSELQLYIVLKLSCFGQTRLSGYDLFKVSQVIGTSERTVKRRLKNLMKLNWIGYDKKSRFYFVRGFKKVCELEGLKGRYCAEFDPSWIKEFNSFAGGAIIGSLVKKQIRRDRRPDCNIGRSVHGRQRPATFKPVATQALSKILDISYSTAYRMKQSALKGIKFLERDDPKKHARCLNIHANQLSEFLRTHPESEGKVFLNQGQIWLNPIDHVRTDITIRSRRRYGKAS